MSMGSNMNFCDKDAMTQLFSSNNTNGEETVLILYKYLYPLLFGICIVSVLINVSLFIIARIKICNKSPVLVLSLNLAVTDTLASAMVGIGFVFNSYLPVVFNVRLHTCPFLAFEIIRTSSLVASALHLLALAIVHYRGITRPFHYRVATFCSYRITRSINLMSLFCWTLPCIIFATYFSSIPCQGFLSKTCDFSFLLFKTYRLLMFSCFFLPLIFMLVIYTKIFFVIKRRRFAPTNIESGDKQPGKVDIQRKRSSRTSSVILEMNGKLVNEVKKASNSFNKVDSNEELESKLEPPRERNCQVSESNEIQGSQEVKQRKISFEDSHLTDKGNPKPSVSNALITTLMILGTYLLCWMPALLFYVLTCVDGCPFPLLEISIGKRVIISFLSNTLIILKPIVDPLIYMARMKEVKIAVKRVFRRSTSRSVCYVSSSRLTSLNQKGKHYENRVQQK